MIIDNSKVEEPTFKTLVEKALIKKPFWNMIIENSYIIAKSKNNNPDYNGTEEKCWSGFDLISSCHHFNYGRIDPEFKNLLQNNHTSIEWKPYMPGISLDCCDDTWFISKILIKPNSLKSKSTFDLHIDPILKDAQQLGAVYIPSKINQFVPYPLCDYDINNKLIYMTIEQNAQLINENLSKSEKFQNLKQLYKKRQQTKNILNILLWIMLLFNSIFIVYYSMF
tara:strand:+ start:1162 stop:1833 length:672 start_codon:yes stop_codon:yes gene_type:complete